jgi:hypothetical protein
MTEPVTLDFLGRQMERLFDRLGAVEDQVGVLTGMVIRLDGSVHGLAVEVAALARSFSRLDARVRKLEDAP